METTPTSPSADVFERLRNGETIAAEDPEAYKMCEASFATKKLLIQMNNTSDPNEVRNLLSQITASDIDQSVNVFTPLYINYGKNTNLVKMFLSISIVYFSTWVVSQSTMAY